MEWNYSLRFGIRIRQVAQSKKDSLGDRMKEYEQKHSYRLIDYLPVLVRIDGKSFHTWTRGLPKPDPRLQLLFENTTQYLIRSFHPLLAYHQSDEISLMFWQNSLDTQLPFGGKIQKLQSVLASATTAYFNTSLGKNIPEKFNRMPLAQFDCRVWNVPNKEEAANYAVWRQNDASRNSLQMLAQTHFSSKELHKKNQSDMHDMLYRIGINWNDCSDSFKRGTFFRRDGSKFYPFLRKCLNKVDVCFDDADPIYVSIADGLEDVA